ncbi:MAG: hypothetical protein GWO20_09015, partial [Candidatus Korarchaeota archaeon]|nr:hypothetical protein [Candidatus Korarchaeota archaeon]
MYDTYGGAGGGVLSLYVKLFLEPNESVRFHFHAPMIDRETERYKLTLKDNEAASQISTLQITVVDLNADFTFNKWKKLCNLEAEIERLTHENKWLNEALERWKERSLPAHSHGYVCSNVTWLFLVCFLITLCGVGLLAIRYVDKSK